MGVVVVLVSAFQKLSKQNAAQHTCVKQFCCGIIIIIIIIHEYYYGGAVALLLQDHLTMSVTEQSQYLSATVQQDVSEEAMES